MTTNKPETVQESTSHDWDDQDKCRRCGDRDWYASATCKPKQQPAVQSPLQRQSVLNLSEAARSLGIAQEKGDQGAIDHWGAMVARFEREVTQPAKQKPVLTEALRQYRNNDSSGLVFGYEKLVVDQYVAGLVETLETLQAECEKLRKVIRRLCNIYVVDDYYSGDIREEQLSRSVERAIDAAMQGDQP